MATTFAVSRNHLIFGLCLPLAGLLGYRLAPPPDSGGLAVIVLVVSVLFVPLMMRWHYALLPLSWNGASTPTFAWPAGVVDDRRGSELFLRGPWAINPRGETVHAGAGVDAFAGVPFLGRRCACLAGTTKTEIRPCARLTPVYSHSWSRASFLRFIFGAFYSDLFYFTGPVGLSVALNREALAHPQPAQALD